MSWTIYSDPRRLGPISTACWQVGHRPDTPVSHGSRQVLWKTCPQTNSLNGSISGSVVVPPFDGPARCRLGGSSKSIKQIAHAARLPSRRTNGRLFFSQLSSHTASEDTKFSWSVFSSGTLDDEGLSWGLLRRRNAKRGRFRRGGVGESTMPVERVGVVAEVDAIWAGSGNFISSDMEIGEDPVLVTLLSP